VPSGMAPQFTAMKGLCFLADNAWMICENTSLPTPLSPFIKTERSVLATCVAMFNAWFNAGALPIIAKRFFIDCKSMPPNPLKEEFGLKLFNAFSIFPK
jgi:hypothetical protein